MKIKVKLIHSKNDSDFEKDCNDFLETIVPSNLIDTELIISHYGYYTLKIVFKIEK